MTRKKRRDAMTRAFPPASYIDIAGALVWLRPDAVCFIRPYGDGTAWGLRYRRPDGSVFLDSGYVSHR